MAGMALIIPPRPTDEEPSVAIGEDAVVVRKRSWYQVYDTHAVSTVTVVDDFSNSTGVRRFTIYTGIDGRTDPTCRAMALDAKQTEDYGKWTVTVTYTSGNAMTGGFAGSPRQNRERAHMARQGIENPTQQPPTNPTQRPPVIRWGSQEYEEELRFDAIVANAPVMTLTKELFVPPPTRTLSFRTLTIERNELFLQFNPITTLGYENKVNGPEFYGLPTKTVLCKSITADLGVEGGIVFWQVTYLFWIRLDDWVLRLAHMGFTEIKNPGEDPVPIVLKRTGIPTSPQPLNNVGKFIPNQPPSTISFNRYATVDFTPLGL